MSEWYDDTAHLKAILEYNCMKQYLMKHEKKKFWRELGDYSFSWKENFIIFKQFIFLKNASKI